MNLRIDNNRIVSLQDRAERLDQGRTPTRAASSQEADSAGDQAAISAVRSQNQASANPIADAQSARTIGLLLQTQIANHPSAAVGAHQLTPRSVKSLLG